MRKLAVVLVAVALAAVGCANEQRQQTQATPDPSPASTGGPVTAIGGKINNRGQKNFTKENFSVELEADNFYFEPTFIVAPGGGKAKIELKNEGDIEHNLSIPARKVDEDVEAGQSKNLTVEVGTDSFVPFYCKYHKAEGMQGSFRLH
jgi:plastocyanin